MNNDSVAMLIIVLFALLAYRIYKRSQMWTPSHYVHGTSRWASVRNLRRAGLLKKKGLLIGETIQRGLLLRLSKYVHLSVVGPTGSGKGVSFVIPTLLTYFTGTLVCFDCKGDLARTTAAYRRKKGQRVIIIDPFSICTKPGESDCFNPLESIGKLDATLIDQARAMAEAIVVRAAEGDKEPFWNESAVNLLTALITATLLFSKEGYRHLGMTRAALSDAELFQKALKGLQALGDSEAGLAGQILTLMKSEKTTADVTTTANTHMAFLLSKTVLGVLSKSTFSADVLLSPGTTIYLVLPSDQLTAQRGFLRLIVSTFIRHILRFGVKNKGETLFLLDECNSLAGLEPIETAYQLGRSYGIRLYTFWQSIEQAQNAFRKTPNLVLDNSDAQIYFGINTHATAELLSKTLGSYTYLQETFNYSDSGSNSTSPGPQGTSRTYQGGWSASRNYSEVARPLLNASEIIQLPSSYMIALLKGCPPVLCRRIHWYSHWLFKPSRLVPVWVILLLLALLLWWAF